MGVREFCYKCLNGFTHKDAYEKHVCDETIIKKKKLDKRTENVMLKNVSHYLKRGITKGCKKKQT